MQPTILERLSRLRLYKRVASIIYRCTDKNHKQYHNYGGRGIRVHQPWIENLWTFVDYLCTLPGWDNPNLWLDRADNEGHYEPGNLRFVTPQTSGRNTRQSKYVFASPEVPPPMESHNMRLHEQKKAARKLREQAESIDFEALRGKRAQIEVALAAGVSQSTLSKLECYGPDAVSIPALLKLLEFYGVEPCCHSA